MSLLKRALCAIRYYTRNTLLLFLIFTILFTLVLSGLCVRQASIDSARQMGIEVGGSLLIDTKPNDENTPGLSLESAEKIAAHPAVQSSTFTSSVEANARKTLWPMESWDENAPEEPHDITLRGSNGVHPALRTDYRMTKGRRPKPEDKGYAVITSYLATAGMKEIEPGDTVYIAPSKESEEEIELTVIGVYASDDSSYRYGPPAGYETNTIYVDLETVAAISGTSDLQGGEFILHDPADMPQLLEDIEAMSLPDREKIGMVALDGDYRKIALSMDSIVGVASLVFWAAIALAAILLTALVMISLSTREFEIGILLSMGESRWKVILQLAIETLLPVLSGVTAGTLLSTQTAAYAAEILGAAAHGVQVGIESWAVGAVYLCGAGLTLLASCVTAYKVLRFNPKKLLLTIE